MLRVGVKTKLLAAMLGAILVATSAMALVSILGFRRGFLGYLNEQGITQFDATLPRVTALYTQHNGWDYLHQHSSAWFDAVGLPGGLTTVPPVGTPFVMRNVDITGAGLRIALLDELGRFVIGVPRITAGSLYRAIVVDGRTVGWLVLVPLQQVTNVADIRFQRRQLLLTCFIGLLAAAVAAGIAVMLANAMIAPLHLIAQSTRQLAAGNYSVRLNIESNDEIAHLATDFNQLALALERTEHLRRNLMADVAHELRTPLAVLRADLEAVQDGVRSASGESLNSLLAEVRTLNKLIDDLHDLSLADVGALSYRKAVLGVDELLQRCIAPFRERFAHKQLRLVTAPTDPELRVFADGSRLQQLLNNLLENSLRYTDAPGETRVSGARDGGEVLMSIDDSAPGVPPELLPRLFERFFRVDSSRNRETGGSGLGLAICRSIVEAHGGSIAAARSMLGGLRIDIRLPLAP